MGLIEIGEEKETIFCCNAIGCEAMLMDGVWSEISIDEIFNLVDTGFTDGVLVNKIASLIEGKTV